MKRSGLILTISCLLAAPALSQIPDEFTNLAVFPKDIGKRELVSAMQHRAETVLLGETRDAVEILAVVRTEAREQLARQDLEGRGVEALGLLRLLLFLLLLLAEHVPRLPDALVLGGHAELLARAAGPEGFVYGQNTPAVIEKYVSETWPARLAKDALANVVRVDSEFGVLQDADSLDLITMIYVYHDALYQPVDRDEMNRALFASLVPGGSLVLIDHRALPGSGEEVGETLHRIDEGMVRRELLAAGFQLAAESDFMANEADPRDEPFFKMEIASDSFAHRYVRPR